jgi:hypothetical protein
MEKNIKKQLCVPDYEHIFRGERCGYRFDTADTKSVKK